MTHYRNRYLVLLRSLIWLLAILYFASSFIGCACLNKIFETKESQGVPQIPPPNQVNLQLASHVDEVQIKKAFSAAVTPNIPINLINVRSCPCDTSLINVSLPSSYTIIIKGAEGPLAVKPPAGATGGDVDLTFSNVLAGSNFRVSPLIDFKTQAEREREPGRTIDTAGKVPTKTVSVAVFDTGLQPDYLPGTSWQQATQQCLILGPSSQIGWNFTSEGNAKNTNDMSSMKHGSRVANLIARQFNSSPILVKIVPMKVLTSSLEGDLFGLLCAMETARKNKIAVFNMSLGYYGVEDSLFKAYVARATNDSIKLVVASGNRSVGDSIAKINRNFSKMTPLFYPAAFGINSNQIFVATTAHMSSGRLLSCGRQNYGDSLVMGVLEDQDCRFVFMSPSAGTNPSLIVGSSYATPVLAGWLARKIVEKPNSNLVRQLLPVWMTPASHGTELYKNAYIKSMPPMVF
ncbi:hypothetical protein BH09BAC4_BH09BAC4_05400 [soil metagenome]